MKIENEELQAQLNAYLEGELPPAEAARLEVFIANTDPKLADQIFAMLADRASVKALPRVQAPSDLAGHIMEKIERASLLNGVESDMHHARRPWWQTRAAIAASVGIVLTGFGFFVYQAVYRPNSPWHGVVANGGGGAGPAVAMKEAASADATAAKISKSMDPELSRDAKLTAVDKAGVPGGGGNVGGPNDNLDTAQVLASLRDAPTVEDQLARAKVAVNVSNEITLNNGFSEAPNASVAISNVTKPVVAKGASSVNGEPMLVCLVARDNADPDRLHSMIEKFIVNDEETARRQDLLPALPMRYNSDNPIARNIVMNNGAQLAMNAPVQTAAEQSGSRNIGKDGAPGMQQAQQQGQQLADQKERREALPMQEMRGYNDRAQRSAYASKGSAKANEQMRQAPGTQLSFNGGVPYRVKLRADQLEQITNNFNVHSVTRGQRAYVINDDQNRNRVTGGNFAATTPAAEGKHTGMAGEAAGNKAESVQAAPSSPAPATTQLAERPVGVKTDGGEGDSVAKWYEVIITMEVPGRLNLNNVYNFNNDAALQQRVNRVEQQQYHGK